jgi:SAM-dependent methyltransferase
MAAGYAHKWRMAAEIWRFVAGHPSPALVADQPAARTLSVPGHAGRSSIRATMSRASTVDQLLTFLGAALDKGTLVKLTLGTPCGADASLRNVFVRPVNLRTGPRLSFVHRHTTKDITKNLTWSEGLTQIAGLLARDFTSAHLFTTEAEVELSGAGDDARLLQHPPRHDTPASTRHDRAKSRLLDERAAWLCALGVTNAAGKVREGMAAKFRQIQKFLENLQVGLADMPVREDRALRLVDMGCGKGYLTFAAFDWLVRTGWQPSVRGIEARPELVELCNRVAAAEQFGGLRFELGTIASTALEGVDVLVALHACDTATDDALAKGIQAGASLILAAPCCHKELRSQLRPPPALAGALRHGILRERQAEFITDALRAALLEWAGYETKVFEFIATEHTAKNLMIAAVKRPRAERRDELAQAARELASFYGIRQQRLAAQLAFPLA